MSLLTLEAVEAHKKAGGDDVAENLHSFEDCESNIMAASSQATDSKPQ